MASDVQEPRDRARSNKPGGRSLAAPTPPQGIPDPRQFESIVPEEDSINPPSPEQRRIKRARDFRPPSGSDEERILNEAEKKARELLNRNGPPGLSFGTDVPGGEDGGAASATALLSTPASRPSTPSGVGGGTGRVRNVERQSQNQSSGSLTFLCHSSGDEEVVRSLYHQLKADNVNCWFDKEDLMPGDDWDREITRAIKRSRYVLVCLSKASINKSGYVQKELKKALDVADEQPEGVAFLIPVRLEECEVPDQLSRWHWVDLFKDGGYERLLRRLVARPGDAGAELPDAPKVETARGPEVDPFKASLYEQAALGALARAWWEVFDETTRIWELEGGPLNNWVEKIILPVDNPNIQIAVKILPYESPNLPISREQVEEMMEILGNAKMPCLLVSNRQMSQLASEAYVRIRKARPRALYFTWWRGPEDDRELRTGLRMMRGYYQESEDREDDADGKHSP